MKTKSKIFFLMKKNYFIDLLNVIDYLTTTHTTLGRQNGASLGQRRLPQCHMFFDYFQS